MEKKLEHHLATSLSLRYRVYFCPMNKYAMLTKSSKIKLFIISMFNKPLFKSNKFTFNLKIPLIFL